MPPVEEIRLRSGMMGEMGPAMNGGTRMATLTWMKRLQNDFLSHDASELNFGSGLRNALAISLPLLLGVLLNQIPAAVVVAIGALVTGFAGLTGTWQERLRAMVEAVLWVTTAAWVGIFVGGAISILPIVFSGGLSGIFSGIRPKLAQSGTLGTTSLIVFAGLAIPRAEAAHTALEVLVGGSLQLAFMLLFVPRQLPNDGSRSLREVLARLGSRYPAAQSRQRLVRGSIAYGRRGEGHRRGHEARTSTPIGWLTLYRGPDSQ